MKQKPFFGGFMADFFRRNRIWPPLQGQWLEALKPEFKKPYYKELFTKVGQEYQNRKIFPAPDDIFNAFHLTPLDQVKVVILGQDPYHNEEDRLMGFAFL